MATRTWFRQRDGCGTRIAIASVAPIRRRQRSRGRAVQTHCALCHGAKGLGDGQMAKLMNPPPRGLVNEPWRYLDASSPERLRESMAGLLRKGLPQAGMPGLTGQVTDAEVAQLVQFVFDLRQ
ncbi:MAG: cytochrome c [Planctomycetes bacterium]|nr:cytochrome c [Planctomycetota bacterium]